MAAIPNCFRIGSERNNYVYQPATQDHQTMRVL